MEQVRVVVVGATGYAGAEVVKILLRHPLVELVAVTSARSSGQPLRDHCSWLDTDLVLSEFNPHLEAEVFVLCRESGFSAEVAPELANRTRVIDLSADFRIQLASDYETSYKRPWPNPKLSAKPVYGLPELVDRKAIRTAQLIANPGCYPTAALLGLMPFLKENLVDGCPIIDAKSGLSGAGRARQETEYLFSEADNSVRAYAPVGHRHTPEIMQMTGRPVRFTPHLVPMARGMAVTLHLPLLRPLTSDAARQVLSDSYCDEPFIRVQAAPPNTKQVLGTNLCAMSVEVDPVTNHAVVMTVIDNLGKGAAGQTIQNLNIMFDFPEPTGLSSDGLWP